MFLNRSENVQRQGERPTAILSANQRRRPFPHTPQEGLELRSQRLILRHHDALVRDAWASARVGRSHQTIDRQLLTRIVERDVRVRLKDAQLSNLLPRNSTRRHIGDAAVGELQTGVGDVHAISQNGDPNGMHRANLGVHHREQDVQVVDHQVEDDVNVQAAFGELAQTVDLEELRLDKERRERSDGRIEPLQMSDLQEHPCLARTTNHALGFLQRARYRFLDKDGHAVFQELARDLTVALGRDGDAHSIHLTEQLAIVGVMADGILGGDRFASHTVDVANTDKHRFRKRSVDSRMLFPNTPDADNGHPQHRLLKCTRAGGREASESSSAPTPACPSVRVPLIISSVDARRWKNEGLRVLLLAGLCALFFFYRLGAMALIGPDEPRYAQVAREMLARHDPITPTIGGQPWLEKPALAYWLMALSMRIFGVSEFAARFPSAFLATLLAFLIYGVGRRVHSPLYGILAACCFIVNPMSFGFARGATTDMPLSATLAAGLCLLFLALQEAVPRKRAWLFSGACFCFGLAILAKGLIGILFPIVIAGSYLLLHRRAAMWNGLGLARGSLVLLLVCASWYGPMLARHGWTFVDEFFIQHHIERYVTERFRHPGPISYYLPVLLVGAFPWTPLLISALARLFIQRYKRDQKGSAEDQALERLMTFAALWMVWPLSFFSLSQSKLPGYVLPIFPATAFLAAREMLSLWRREADRLARIGMLILPLFVSAIATLALFYAKKELEAFDPLKHVLFWGGLGGGLLGLGLSLAARSRALLVFVLLLCAASVPSVLSTFQPLIEKKESFQDLAEIALRAFQPGERLIGYGWFHHSLTFYTNARSIYDEHGRVRVLFSPHELIEVARHLGSVLVVAKRSHVRQLRESPQFEVELIGERGEHALLRVKLLE